MIKVIMYVTIKIIELLPTAQLLKRQIPHMQDKIYLKAAKICFLMIFPYSFGCCITKKMQIE